MSVFHAAEDGKGMNPLRLALFPRLMPLQAGAPVDRVTTICAEADFVESWVEVAVIVAVSALAGGVKVTDVPELMPVVALRAPPPDGLTERFTVFVKAPVPVTVGVQVEVSVVVMLVGLHTRVTPVMAGVVAVTVMFAEPEIFV
jgi:hypothetical protein